MTTHDKPPTARAFATLWRLLLAWCLSVTTLLCSLFSIYACAGIWSARGKENFGRRISGCVGLCVRLPARLGLHDFFHYYPRKAGKQVGPDFLVFSFNPSFALYRLHCCRVLQKVSRLTAGIMLRISTRLDSLDHNRNPNLIRTTSVHQIRRSGRGQAPLNNRTCSQPGACLLSPPCCAVNFKP